ncbi:ribosome small subunit-dependent GTPase A [Butyrivibrio sp. NC3005]|uniref:ribosome small subunit-dependent GTPase A n=1 Tax=Butyrivibrio sp. NC3005 TaxID=1280685 RepID=UPI00041687E6|nr:ribosome small subunit-dependent GTPase A [Butyrivibrio sp. NC3005]
MQGRIIKGIAGFYYVDATDGKLYECRAKGIFRQQKIKPMVGDIVEIDIVSSDDATGNVISILPRKNELLRPPVSNIDQALIIFAIVHPNPSYNLLDRFLIMMRQQNLPVLICFNKQDIASEKEQQELRETYEKCGYEVMFISVAQNKGIDELKKRLEGKTTVLAGPSGVGKSSLLNLLHPQANMETGELSKKILRGKNTTRHSELFHLNGIGDNTYLCDTPGFTSLYLKDVTIAQLPLYYPEFEDYEPSCRFGGCVHISEPDCGVKNAVEKGLISHIRYENYQMLYEDLKSQKKVYGKNKREY